MVTTAVRDSAYVRTAEGGWALDGGGDPLRLPLHRIALLADRFLADPGPAAVGRCPGEGCGWLFLHQGGRRRWCIMAVCGNRAKSRRRSDRRGLVRENPFGLVGPAAGPQVEQDDGDQ
ncbi:hypothetical protein GIS00_22780 [Nakamurella sp. YIM 132087]|uniref:Zinc finger CGNR domain-containing protein n=1 Tax=Nakamurella alba TaxID=2665158 RepID=A0A7K1FRJ9_9ACTN|nr:hypothetical protein [Nakamurella alba]